MTNGQRLATLRKQFPFGNRVALDTKRCSIFQILCSNEFSRGSFTGYYFRFYASGSWYTSFVFQNIFVYSFVRHRRPSAASIFDDMGRILCLNKSSRKSDQHPKKRRACDCGPDIVCKFLNTEKLLALNLRTKWMLIFNNSRSEAMFASSALHVLRKKTAF